MGEKIVNRNKEIKESWTVQAKQWNQKIKEKRSISKLKWIEMKM